jgi:hypothetical protein
MILHRILALIVKRFWFLVMLLGFVSSAYMERTCPKKPEPASGHVLRVFAPGTRRSASRHLYLTSSERFLYHASLMALFGGMLGSIGVWQRFGTKWAIWSFKALGALQESSH